MLRQADARDALDDQKYGKGKRGDEVPEELRHAESRLARIRAAKAELEAEANVLAAADGFVQAYNCQAAVDDAHQIIVAEAVTNRPPGLKHNLLKLHRAGAAA